ncbi:MAG: hypothetical protein N2442_04670 [Spirochaetes bacterium]|nr:hypothetical protein [Spirochaetota bacterium]
MKEMSMTDSTTRRIKIAFAILTTILILSLFSGCDLFMAKGVTIEERIDMFMKDVNAGNYGNLYTHFHPQDTQQRQQVASASFWTPYFQQGTIYSYKIQTVILDIATVTVTGGVWSSTPFLFTMAKSGDDYYIKKLAISGATIVESYLFK